MQFNTAYSNGDKVFAVGPGNEIVGPWTVGKVQVECVDSAGLEGETLFDNYKPQGYYRETYMLVESGIGTGTCYKSENLYPTLEEAQAAVFVPYC